MKFKLWDIFNECWYERGDIYLNEDGQLYRIEELGSYERYMDKENVNARYELVRYTGLKDKNGVEIYEGDIIRSFNPIGVVKWINSGWRVEWKDYESYLPQVLNSGEVNGNIYENGDLLSVSND